VIGRLTILSLRVFPFSRTHLIIYPNKEYSLKCAVGVCFTHFLFFQRYGILGLLHERVDILSRFPAFCGGADRHRAQHMQVETLILCQCDIGI